MKHLALPICILLSVSLYAQNVGIGTPAPATKLHIISTNSEVLRVEAINPYISFFSGNVYKGYLWYDGNELVLGTPAAESIVLSAGYSPSAYFTATGRVGINTAAPTERLDVAGNINLRGTLKIDGSAGTRGQVYTTGGASFNPEWRTLAFANNTRCGVDLSLLGAGGIFLNVSSTYYNLNPADITVSSSGLTINKSGLYRIEGNYDVLVQGSGLSYIPEYSITLVMSVGTAISYNLESFTKLELRGAVSNNYKHMGRYSIDLYLPVTTNIRMTRNILTAGGVVTAMEANSNLFIHLISE